MLAVKLATGTWSREVSKSGRPTSTVTFHAGGVGPRTVHLRREEGEREEDQPYIGRIVNNKRGAAVESPSQTKMATVISGLLSRHLSLTCGIEERRRRGGRRGCSSSDHFSKADQGSKEKLEGESETHGMCGQACGLK